MSDNIRVNINGTPSTIGDGDNVTVAYVFLESEKFEGSNAENAGLASE